MDSNKYTHYLLRSPHAGSHIAPTGHKMRHLLMLWLLLACTQAACTEDPNAPPVNNSSTQLITCAPEARGNMTLQALRPGFHTATGHLGGFDPCERLVRYRVPKSDRKPALMISIHGGGGSADVVLSDEAFYRQGMATLMFDAYAMQGLPGRDPMFWARSVTNEARQRMIWATAIEAYRWALTRREIDTSRIYLFGLSNGAAVVANMAGVVDSAHVRGVIAEGVTPIGLGLPDEIKVPVLLAFGRLDDFGNVDPNGKRWTMSDDCRLNVYFDDLPAGTARTCNGTTPGQRIPTPLQWVEQIRHRGGPLEVLYVDEMAHSAFWGPLTQRRATWGNGQTMGASLGATPAARERFFNAMLDFIARTDR